MEPQIDNQNEITPQETINTTVQTSTPVVEPPSVTITDVVSPSETPQEQPKQNKKIPLIIILIIIAAIIIGVVLIIVLKPDKQVENPPVETPVVEEDDKTKIVFQVFDDETKTYKDTYTVYLKPGENLTEHIPEVPDRQYYSWNQTWTPSLEETVGETKTYKANYVPKNDTNNDNVADEEQVKIVFQVWDNKTKAYKDAFNGLVTIGSSISEYIPKITEREYYTTNNTWSPELEDKATTNKTYQAVYVPKNDVNKNGIADETDKKYTVTYYKDSKCQEVHKKFTNVLVGTTTPVPSNPTRKYYTFNSWYPNNTSTVTANAKYCAVWKPNNDTNNDNIADEEQTSTPSTSLTIEAIKLTTTDDKNYTFTYGNETYSAVYTTDNWKIVNSYKITNKADMVVICSALIEKHKVHGKDMVSYRTAEDMAYEWEQHNLLYYMLPEGHDLKDNARDVDLNPSDQGKSLQQMYEDRLGTMF